MSDVMLCEIDESAGYLEWVMFVDEALSLAGAAITDTEFGDRDYRINYLFTYVIATLVISVDRFVLLSVLVFQPLTFKR
jgi:hypothetical protein